MEPLDKVTAEAICKVRYNQPEQYSGTPKITVFQKWLSDLVIWLEVSNMTGPATDRLRLCMISSNLTAILLRPGIVEWTERTLLGCGSRFTIRSLSSR